MSVWRPRADNFGVSSAPDPAARCPSCDATWNSPAMVEGLRLLKTCPKCGTGAIAFRDDAVAAASGSSPSSAAGLESVAPHRALGTPRLG